MSKNTPTIHSTEHILENSPVLLENIPYITVPTRRIYLGKVREGITEENVKEYFEANYACKVENVDLIKNKEGEEPKLRLLIM